MISVVVAGQGVVVWRRPGEWKAFGRSDRARAMLSAWAWQVLNQARDESPDAVREALLSIHGAELLTESSDAPG